MKTLLNYILENKHITSLIDFIIERGPVNKQYSEKKFINLNIFQLTYSLYKRNQNNQTTTKKFKHECNLFFNNMIEKYPHLKQKFNEYGVYSGAELEEFILKNSDKYKQFIENSIKAKIDKQTNRSNETSKEVNTQQIDNDEIDRNKIVLYHKDNPSSIKTTKYYTINYSNENQRQEKINKCKELWAKQTKCNVSDCNVIMYDNYIKKYK